MQARKRLFGSLLGMLVLAALLARCESTDLSAPADGTLTVRAIPTTAVIDTPSQRARSTIEARVLDADGVPVESAVVSFSPAAGTLQDNVCGAGGCSLSGAACADDGDCPLTPGVPASAKTDGKGLATAVLVVTANDLSSVSVSATSGALTGSASVFNPLNDDNEPPQAAFVASPPSPAKNGGPISLDGSGSSDPDQDEITCFQWTISSSIPIEEPEEPCVPPLPTCTVIQGDRNPVLNYLLQQRLTIKLRVSDDRDALPCGRSPLVDQALFSPLDATVSYILCNNKTPTAIAGSYGPLELPNPPSVSVTVNGSGSSDPETATGSLDFAWDCGNGTTRTGLSASCTYTAVGSFVLKLTVSDTGNGDLNCVKSASNSTVIQVVDEVP